VSRLLTRGQPAATAAVAAMISGRVPHAILIAGPMGVGKSTLALDLAAGLLCEAVDPAERPCRECRACRLVDRGIHADLHLLAPTGPGNQIRIGDRTQSEPGTVRRLIADLALLPVEGGARVALIEHADRMNEDAQSALLKTLEEPPTGVTIVLCVDREDQMLPTVRSRCVRLRLGPVGVRDVEAILAEQGVADAPTAARLARLSAGLPGIARAWARAPQAVTARAEICRSLLDLTDTGVAGRLGIRRDVLTIAAEIDRALDAAGRHDAQPEAAAHQKRARAAVTEPEDRPAPDGDPADQSGTPDGPRDLRIPAAERRRAAATLVAIWRDVARDLALVGLGDEARLRDPTLIEEFRGAAGIGASALAAFLVRLDRTAELLEANVSPELAIDVLLVAWPRRARAA
jgi:DNA polymerase III delta' subunit